MSVLAAGNQPLLRTLSPALRRLDAKLRGWFDAPRRRSLSTVTMATFEGLSLDLQRQSTALDVEQPLLVIMLMGGTGVGKSSLLNAIAHGPVAQASFSRPTTRDPVVYYHHTIRPDRLDSALKQCRLVAHDRPGMEHKILVDTPDLDSNEPANRDKLKRLLPVADVVLYVGSQEKYHDKLGWELFLEHRKRRAFAFVLNKWDRCLHGVAEKSGLRPDEDLLRDLRDEGFESPLLFRTCAQAWIESNGRPPSNLPEEEQFADLEHWLELGLTRLEIEAIKARGVSQLLAHVEESLEGAKPPDLLEIAGRTRQSWEEALDEEARARADLLLATIDPYQREIEQHFAMEGHKRFSGLMAWFLRFTTRWRYAGLSWRSRLPRPLRVDLAHATTASAWDLAAFGRACSGMASDRHLDARNRALPNRLLVLADQTDFPVSLLSEPTEAAAKVDWRQRLTGDLVEALHDVESEWSNPTGMRRGVQGLLIFLGNVLPYLVFLASAGFLLYGWFKGTIDFSIWQILMPFAVVLLTLMLLYALIALLLPIRWPAIRGTFLRHLTERLRAELNETFLPIPQQLAEDLNAERAQIEQVLVASREVFDWLRQREQAASIAPLYGKS